TSSADSPNLILDLSNPNDSFTDSLLTTAAGYNLEADAIAAMPLHPAAGVGSVAPGGSFTFTETRAIQAGDPTPLTDTSNVVFTLAQNLGNFSNQISAGSSASVILVPHLTISKTVTGDGTSAVIHPGDTASFTITVTDDGAAAASGIVVTDQLPDPTGVLTWNATSSTFTTSVSGTDFLKATLASLAAGSSATITVSTLVPADIFGPSPGPGNGDPVPFNLF